MIGFIVKKRKLRNVRLGAFTSIPALYLNLTPEMEEDLLEIVEKYDSFSDWAIEFSWRSRNAFKKLVDF